MLDPLIDAILAGVGSNPVHIVMFGVSPVQFGEAAVLGQMTTGFPVSPLTPATFLIVGLAGIELRDHQKFAAPYLFAASVLMTFGCVALGVFPM